MIYYETNELVERRRQEGRDTKAGTWEVEELREGANGGTGGGSERGRS